MRNDSVNKRERAIELRDRAIILLKTKGSWAALSGAVDTDAVRALTYKTARRHIVLRTPFQKLPWSLTGAQKYAAAQNEVTLGQNLPYGLDIWAGRKVLNIEWDLGSVIEVVSYKPGDWERDLEALLDDGGEETNAVTRS